MRPHACVFRSCCRTKGDAYIHVTWINVLRFGHQEKLSIRGHFSFQGIKMNVSFRNAMCVVSLYNNTITNSGLWSFRFFSSTRAEQWPNVITRVGIKLAILVRRITRDGRWIFSRRTRRVWDLLIQSDPYVTFFKVRKRLSRTVIFNFFVET